jgi:hypothetical protein
MASGIIAAVAGPNIARMRQGAGDISFLWLFLALLVLGIVATAAISGLRLPPLSTTQSTGPPRPLSQITGKLTFITC